MRVLVLSDIHANLQALDAVLQAAPPWDVVWNLGDIVGYGANPNETVTAAQNLPGAVVRGNHDRACAGLADLEEFHPVAAQAARWTQSVLTDAHRDWLAALPAGPLSPAGSGAQLVHGSPLDEDDYVISPGDGRAVLEASDTRVTFFGHTHVQGGFATNGDDEFRLTPLYTSDSAADSYELPLRKGARYLLNPGSVGQPRDGDWRAGFAFYDTERDEFVWHRVPYDVKEAQRAIQSAGLPDFLSARLKTGR